MTTAPAGAPPTSPPQAAIDALAPPGELTTAPLDIDTAIAVLLQTYELLPPAQR